MSAAGADARPAVPKHLWPGPSPWMAGDLRFYIRWLSRSDLHEVGAGITRSVVPVLRQSGYEVVQQAADELVLRRAVSVPASIAAQRGFVRQAEVRIVIADQGDHTITEAYGVAPQHARQAIAQLVY